MERRHEGKTICMINRKVKHMNEKQIQVCSIEIHVHENSNQGYARRHYSREKINKKSILAAIMVILTLSTMTGCGQSQERTYKQAQELLASGKYQEAAEKFDKVTSISDAAKYNQYARALQAVEEGNYADAIKTLEGLGDFLDATSYVKYLEAAQTAEGGTVSDLKTAKSIYETIPLFKDSKERIEKLEAAIEEMKEKNPAEGASVGDIIEFGSYEQDADAGNGPEPIAWRVLAVEDDRALVISQYALDARPYNTKYVDVTWETCTLRQWLNEDFLNEAFSEEQQEMILLADILNEDNEEFGTVGGENTQDQIFLLSIKDAEKLFDSDEDRMVKATEYAVEQGAYISEGYGERTCVWWLRSPGCLSNYAAYVYVDGSLFYLGHGVSLVDFCVRPALWINLEP